MKLYTIADKLGTEAGILPAKGATVISLKKNGRDFLYRNNENLRSSERPRCGIPFLFPIFGRLTQGQYRWEGKAYSMGIHGFGHTSVWAVASSEPDRLVLTLEATEETLSQYPFRFRVTLDFTVADGALTISQTYENLDTKPMPYNYGFHPYFLTKKLEDLQVETDADTYFDFAKGPSAFGCGSVTLTMPKDAPETGAAFMGVHGPTVLRNEAGGRVLTMEFDRSFHTHVLWAQRERPFLCAEPVNGTADGFNTGSYLTLNPGETKKAYVRLRPEII